jgi:adenylate kinase
MKTPKRLVIAVTGTPGTGKTTFSRALCKHLSAELFDLNQFIVSTGIYRLDDEGTKVVDIRKMRSGFRKVIRDLQGHIVVDGMLSHFLPNDVITHVVVLRTHPRALEKRLKRRGFGGKKLEDNLEAEALDVVLWEAVENHGISKVYEIDTTKASVERCVRDFMSAMAGKKDLRPGRISWLGEYFRL